MAGFEERGLPEKGAEYHRQAVELRETLPDKGEYAFSLGNLGVALLSAGKLKDAEKYLKKCLSSYGQAGLDSRPEYAAFARNLEICEETLSPKQ
ncbi:MAG: tetratricopeptide repeat protein [Desulfovibrio sp.]|nr:tetratricopeptide repeat protein [Desulfovibrio sp.]